MIFIFETQSNCLEPRMLTFGNLNQNQKKVSSGVIIYSDTPDVISAVDAYRGRCSVRSYIDSTQQTQILPTLYTL